MKLASLIPWKKTLVVAAMTMGFSGFMCVPQPVAAAGLADWFAGLTIQQGCTQFMGPYGSPVTVQYFLPKSSCPSPAVIVLHGSDGGARHQDDYEEVGKGLAAKGFSAFLVHYYEGVPGASHPGPNDRGLPDPRAFVPWVATVESSVAFVQAFPGVDPNRVGILGMSLGGFIGSSVAVNNPNIKALIMLSAGMPTLASDKMKTMPPTLIVHGDQDRDVSVWEAYKLHDLMARKGLWHDLVILPCEGHLPYQRYKSDVAEKVLSFLQNAL